MFDKRMVALEIINPTASESVKRELNKDEFLVSIKRFFPKDWSLSERIDVIVKKNWNLR